MSSTPTLPAGSPPPPQKFTFAIWLILVIASIGFAFDIYELLMLPLVMRPALADFGIEPTLRQGGEEVLDAEGNPVKHWDGRPKLKNTKPVMDDEGNPKSNPEFSTWVGLMFYVPAFAGGIFGLLGGYLTDFFGRRSVLTWSILLYAVSAFLAGFSTNPWMLLFLRSTTFVGVCIEFVAAVAWLAELFPNPHQRETVLGYTQAFSSIGGLLVATANSLAVAFAEAGRLPAVVLPDFLSFLGKIQIDSDDSLPWRYTLMSGLIPAIPLILIRPFLPESPAWAKKKSEGTLKRPSFAGLFSPELRRTTIVTMIMFACSYGAAFGAIQQMPQIAPGLTKDVKEYSEKIQKGQEEKNKQRIERGEKEKPVAKGKQLEKLAEQKLASDYTKVQEIGGLLGRFCLAALAVWIVSRRGLLRIFQIPGLLFMPVFFWFFLTVENQVFFKIPLEWAGIGSLPVTTVSLGMMLAGLFTVAQFSFWGNYLPRVYPLHLRGTGESFAANIGGRLIGTSFAAVTAWLSTFTFLGDSQPARFAHAAAIVAGFVYVCGLIASFFLPEPKGEID